MVVALEKNTVENCTRRYFQKYPSTADSSPQQTADLARFEPGILLSGFRAEAFGKMAAPLSYAGMICR